MSPLLLIVLFIWNFFAVFEETSSTFDLHQSDKLGNVIKRKFKSYLNVI